MPASSVHRPLLIVGVVSLGVMAWCLGETGRGAPPIEKARAGGDPNRGAAKAYRYAQQCKFCHDPNNPGKIQPLLIKYEEYPDWHDRDKHSYAYQALTAQRGKDMGKLLEIDVTTDAACLNCHAPGYRAPTEQDLAKAEGVSCHACHSSFDNDRWFAAHTNPGERWRDKSMDVKENDYGLLRVRDPVKRSEICLSCHLGNAGEGKVLTHEMYAAGHPPLSGFDTATFSLAEPPHWLQPTEVPAFTGQYKENPGRIKNFAPDLSSLHHTKMVLVSEVIALRQAMKLMAAQAKAADKGPAWPEFAHFECYSCHHDLKSPGFRQWRQVRGFAHQVDGLLIPGQAGRPQFRLWPTALVRLAISQAGGDQEGFTAAMRRLYGVSDTRVFGTATDVAETAGHLAEWADQLLARLDLSKLGQDDVPRLLRALVSLPTAAYPDYDSARQIAWAFDIIYSEWTPKPASAGRIQAILEQMRQDLKLDPFQARDDWPGAAGDPETYHQKSESELVRSLIRAAEYDPDTFKDNLRRLVQLLPAR
jgi:hypothetical protein